jgi:S1-C subfamily serine protease
VIDVVLLLLMLAYAVSGYRQGLVVGVLSLGGFLGGAVVAMTVVPILAANLEPGLQRSVLVLVAVLLLAWLGQLVGSLVGGKLHERISLREAQVVDQVLGAVAGVLSLALVMWFVAGALRGSPSPVIARAVASSRVLSAVDAVVPEQLSALADGFRATVAGSTFPRVFTGVGPERIFPVEPPNPQAMSAEVLASVRQSVVKITGDAPSCQRGQEGSGAVIAPGRVLTNAHVVAGVDAPTVQVGGTGRRYAARVVVFDPERDLAVLVVKGLGAPALTLGTDLRNGDDAVVAGFPRNGPFVASSARIRSVIRASGDDIYGRPGVVREVYSLYATVEPGNSGGPVVAPDGSLVGVVFAKSLDDPRTGYALTLAESRPVISAGLQAADAVPTGKCAVG